MAVELNHTIVNATDQDAEAAFVAEVLGLPAPTRFGHFTVVAVANGVSLDFMTSADPASQHYAFLISEPEFDEVAARLAAHGADTWADPMRRTPGHNTHNGGRGMYFDSPSGHNLEVLTTPYA
ncbi:MAG: VOC family protein [Pseudonocardiaceae bacterium]|nr:MAG: VOC family protein [Pseudonocardiaceae bacterium]